MTRAAFAVIVKLNGGLKNSFDSAYNSDASSSCLTQLYKVWVCAAHMLTWLQMKKAEMAKQTSFYEKDFLDQVCSPIVKKAEFLIRFEPAKGSGLIR